MAQKATLTDIDTKIDALTTIVEKGFGAIADDIADIKRDMATKEQLAALHTQVNSIETELKHGRYEVRIGNLETKVFGAPRH